MKTILGASADAAVESGLLTHALPAAGKALMAAGVVVDAGARAHQAYQVEQKFRRGDISDRDRVIAHAKNVAGMAGGWGGATALGSQGALWGSALGPVGTIVGGAGGGALGYVGGEKLAEGAVEIGSGVIYAGLSATRGTSARAGEVLRSGVDAACSGAEHVSKLVGASINSARTRLGW